MLLARTTLLIVTLTPGAAAHTAGLSPFLHITKSTLLSPTNTASMHDAPPRRAPVSRAVPNTTLPGGARPAKCRTQSGTFALTLFAVRLPLRRRTRWVAPIGLPGY